MANSLMEQSKSNTNLLPRNLAKYIRVSSNKQEGNTSKETQLKAIDGVIANNNWTKIPFEIYDDTFSASHKLKHNLVGDGLNKSGDFDDFNHNIFLRKDLRRLIYDASLKKFDTLLVYSHDRLSRDVHESLFIRHTLKKLNINIIYCKPGEQLNSGNNSSDTFFENLLNSLAALEANIIGGRTFLGNKTNIANNLWAGGSAPYGYFLIPSTNINHRNKSILEVNPLEATIVRKIFKLYVSGYTPENIADYLTNEGNTSRLWGINSIKSILNNPTYTGTIVWNKKGGSRNPRKKSESEHVKSQYMNDLRIIDQETWQKARYVGELQRKRPKFLSTQFLLRDIAYCNKCGSKLACKNHGNSARSVYMCNNKECSGRFTIKSTKIQEVILDKILSIFSEVINSNDKEYLDTFYLEYSQKFIEKQKSLINEKKQLEIELKKISGFILACNKKIKFINDEKNSCKSEEKSKYDCLIQELEEYKIYLELVVKQLNSSIESLREQLKVPILQKDYIKDLFGVKIKEYYEINKEVNIKLKNRRLRLFLYELIDKILIDNDKNINIYFK